MLQNCTLGTNESHRRLEGDRHRVQLAKDTCGSLQVCVGLINRTDFLLRYNFLEVMCPLCRVRSALLFVNR
jgi:hypothetical protein